MMNEDIAVSVVRDALITMLKITLPILTAGVVFGLVVSIFQSVTQIQEQTLSLVPKIVVMTLVAIVLLPWILGKLVEFAGMMFELM